MRRDDAAAIWLQAVTFKTCMLDVNEEEESTHTRWRSLVPNHLQEVEWVSEGDGNYLRGVPNLALNFASFKLAARPGSL